MAITTSSQSQLGQDTAKNSQIVTTAVKLVNSGASTGPLINSVIITDSGYNNIDDTAVGTSNSFIKIIGSGFIDGANVFVGGTQVPAANVTFTSSTELRVRLPVLTSGTNNAVSIFNSAGSGAIYASNLFASGFPTVTTSSYTSLSTTVSVQLLATGDGTLSYSLKSGSSLPAGLSLSSTGLISGTSVDGTSTFIVLVDDSQGQTTQQEITLVINATDTYYKYTTLLLQSDNTSNNSTNDVFVDSADSTQIITPTGKPVQGTINPFGVGNWSNYFDGAGDYLQIANNAAFDFGSGDFTIEAWVYQTTLTGGGGVSTNGCSIFGTFPLNGTITGWNLTINSGAVTFDTWVSGNEQAITSNTLVLANQWNHVALTKSSGTYRIFINGTSVGFTGSINQAINSGGNTIKIGALLFNNSFFNYLTGYISNARVIKGTALYTTTFTPSTTPLTAIANTSLLTCQANSFKDSSNNAFAVTVAGNSAVERFNPFGLNSIGYEVSANTFAGSTYFDGTGDVLNVAPNTAFAFGTGDFTVELWFNVPSWTPDAQLIGCHTSGGGYDWLVQYYSGSLRWLDASLILGFSSSPAVNQWNHFAISRSGITLRVFLNGTQIASDTSTANISSTKSLGIMGDTGGASTQIGYVSNVRVLKGTALYTSNFTPSTVPLTAVANTSLLTCQSSQSVTSDESTNKFTISVGGTPSATKKTPFTLTDTSTANTTYGGSIYFGSGNYLTATTSTGLSSNFTIETWFNLSSPQSDYQMICGQSIAGTGQYLAVRATGIELQCGTTAPEAALITYSFNTNTWYHLAVVRNSGTVSMYVNGNSISVTLASQANTFNVKYIGMGYNTSYPFLGYLSNFRVTNTVVYATAFTPPTAPLTAISGTQLLLSGKNSGIYDATLQNNIRVVGDAKVKTNVYKYGTGSMYFDGTTDYAVVPTSTNFGYGTGDFTIEFWMYLGTIADDISIISNLTSVSSVNPHIYFTRVGRVLVYQTDNATKISSSAALNASTWYHVALCRSSGSTKMFIDGTQVGSTYTDSNNYGTSAPLAIGTYWSSGTPVTTNTFNGYLDDIRITKGYARYTANFTPPNSALKNK
jgi:hypothetical protein